MKTRITLLFLLLTCFGQAQISVIVSTTDLDCNSINGLANGSADFNVSGGIEPYTYTWGSPDGCGIVQGVASQSTLCVGSYWVTVVDSNGDSAEVEFTLTEPSAVEVTGEAIDLDCNLDSGPATGSIDITVSGGTGAYTYNWSTPDGHMLEQTIANQTGLWPGTYSVTVTDANGCIIEGSWTLSEPDRIEVVADVMDAYPNGAVDLTVSGGTTSGGVYAYNWETVDGSGLVPYEEDQSGLGAGTYYVTVTDENGCTSSESHTLAGSEGLECSLDSPIVGVGGTNVLCAGDIASLTVTAAGGIAPYSYSIDGFIYQSNPNFEVEVGSHTIVTVDENGSETSCDISITGPATMILDHAVIEDECQLDAGEIAITISEGGTFPCQVTWVSKTGGFLDQSSQVVDIEGGQSLFTGAQGGETYVFTIVDANGCHYDAPTVTIEGSTTGQVLALSAEVIHDDCNIVDSPHIGSIDLTVEGGSPPYSYAWTTPDGDPNFDFTAEDLLENGPGTFTVVVTDANNCTARATYSINDVVRTIEVLLDVHYNEYCISHHEVPLYGTPIGGNYSGAGVNANEFYPALAGVGTHTIRYTYTDANGCQGTATQDIMVGDSSSNICLGAFNYTLVEIDDDCIPGGGVLQVSCDGGIPPYTVSHNTGSLDHGTLLIWENGEKVEFAGVEEGVIYEFSITAGDGAMEFFEFQSGVTHIPELAAPHLCLVTNDNQTGNNEILWEDPSSVDHITQYNIYREGNATGEFVLVGTVPFSDENVFVDKDVDPSVQAYLYQVRSATDCDVESEASNIHKTIHLVINQGVNDKINLAWDTYDGIVYTQVNIYRGSSPDDLVLWQTLPATTFSFTDADPPSGALYYQIEIVGEVECATKQSLFSIKSNIEGFEEPSSLAELTFNVNIYPNPVQNQLNIEVDQDLSFSLMDAKGTQLLKKEIQAGHNTINLKDLASGMYFVRLANKEKIQIEKIMVQAY